MTRRKRRQLIKSVAIAITAIVVLTVAVVALYYINGSSEKTHKPSGPTLLVGDTFTYNLSGSTVIGTPDVETPAEFLQFNETDYYQVTVTAINGSQVSLETIWQFKNGTQFTSPQIIDLSTGGNAEPTEFSYLYPSNLNVTNKLYPAETGNLAVNSSSTQRFAESTRTINSWSTEDQFINTGDQTANTMRYDYVAVNFDKQTGILVSLTRIEFFTNPEIQLTTTWQLTDSNAWAVK